MVLVIAGVLLFSLAKKSVGKTAHAAAPEAAAPEAAVGSGVDGGDGFRYSHTRHLLNAPAGLDTVPYHSQATVQLFPKSHVCFGFRISDVRAYEEMLRAQASTTLHIVPRANDVKASAARM